MCNVHKHSAIAHAEKMEMIPTIQMDTEKSQAVGGFMASEGEQFTDVQSLIVEWEGKGVRLKVEEG